MISFNFNFICIWCALCVLEQEYEYEIELFICFDGICIALCAIINADIYFRIFITFAN